MSGTGDDGGICPWCLVTVHDGICGTCRSKPVGADDFEPSETFRYSRQIVGGRYRVLRHIGRGGMGDVYKAFDSTANEMVAIKFLLEGQSDDEDALKLRRTRFQTECKTLARLKSPYIVRFLDDEEADDGTPALVMELLRGQTLADLLRCEKILSPPQIVDVVVPVCRALQAAHDKGFVHRDLKPENIFLHDDGDGARVVKVLDFGIARVLQDAPGGNPGFTGGEAVGTWAYMSPEYCRNGSLSHKSDLFSLGCILYRLVSGRLPFERPNDLAICGAIILDEPAPFPQGLEVPPELRKLIDQLLQKVPERRPDSAADVERLLLAAVHETPSSRVRLSTRDRDWLNAGGAGIRRGSDTDEIGRPQLEKAFISTPAAPAANPRPVPEIPPSPVVPVTTPGFLVRPAPRHRPARGRPRGKLLIAGVVAASLVVVLSAWGLLRANARDTISSIAGSCRVLSSKELDVEGVVLKSKHVPRTNLSAYELSDGKASIWVITRSKPVAGESLAVRAMVIEKDAWADICSGNNPPRDCGLITTAMAGAGTCALLELDR